MTPPRKSVRHRDDIYKVEDSTHRVLSTQAKARGMDISPYLDHLLKLDRTKGVISDMSDNITTLEDLSKSFLHLDISEAFTILKVIIMRYPYLTRDSKDTLADTLKSFMYKALEELNNLATMQQSTLETGAWVNIEEEDKTHGIEEI